MSFRRLKTAHVQQTLNWAPRCALSFLMPILFVGNLLLFSILSAVEISPGTFMGIKRETIIKALNLCLC